MPHEKTNHAVAKKIKDVLESRPTEAEQEEMHQNDEDTGWFGILREEGELPLFADYGRFANLMAVTSASQQPDRGTYQPNAPRDTRYPSLVSFVGETGTLLALHANLPLC